MIAKYSAWRLRMLGSAPAASPAATMLQNSSEKHLPHERRAFEKLRPSRTCWRRNAATGCNADFSLRDSITRSAGSSWRPESSISESSSVKSSICAPARCCTGPAASLAAPEPVAGLPPAALSISMETGRSFRARS